MIVAVNYADERYKNAQKFNSKRALKFGADRVISYTYDDLPEDFKNETKEFFELSPGRGFFVWKPFIILKALEELETGDYLVYTDSGSSFVNSINLLIENMNREHREIMCFCIDQIEKKWSKRDAFVLMGCDSEEYWNSPQICGGYVLVKKSEKSISIIKEWSEKVKDLRIVSDGPNVMGKENMEGFVGNRHDQTVWSLLCKREGIIPFRDPSEWGLDFSLFPKDVIARSKYPQIIESHRNGKIKHFYELNYRRWYKWIDPKRTFLLAPFRFFLDKVRVLGGRMKVKIKGRSVDDKNSL